MGPLRHNTAASRGILTTTGPGNRAIVFSPSPAGLKAGRRKKVWREFGDRLVPPAGGCPSRLPLLEHRVCSSSFGVRQHAPAKQAWAVVKDGGVAGAALLNRSFVGFRRQPPRPQDPPRPDAVFLSSSSVRQDPTEEAVE